MSIEAALQIEAALIRRQAPDLLLREGQTFAARVAERSGARGIIVLAGSPLLAELPDSVQTGDKLRLLVAETKGEKVLMKLVPEQAAQAPSQATISIALPGGGHVHIEVDQDAQGGGEGSDAENASIALTYDSPELGTLGLRLALAPGALTVLAEAARGRAYEIADDASDALRRRLETMTGRATQVSVVPRHESIDAYA
jgi:hypothetical protein